MKPRERQEEAWLTTTGGSIEKGPAVSPGNSEGSRSGGRESRAKRTHTHTHRFFFFSPRFRVRLRKKKT